MASLDISLFVASSAEEQGAIADIIVDRIAFLLTYFSVGMTNAVEAMALGKQLRQIQMQLQSLIGALAVDVAQSILFFLLAFKSLCKKTDESVPNIFKMGHCKSNPKLSMSKYFILDLEKMESEMISKRSGVP